jgi:hypothetical protein
MGVVIVLVLVVLVLVVLVLEVRMSGADGALLLFNCFGMFNPRGETTMNAARRRPGLRHLPIANRLG